MPDSQGKPITKNPRRYSTLNPSRAVGSAFKKAAAHIEVPLTELTDTALVKWLKTNRKRFPHIEIPELKN